MPRTILIRDDDICYFTKIDQFQLAHRLLLDMRLPINVAVIPQIRGSSTPQNVFHEEFVPQDRCEPNRLYPIYKNTELVSFLNSQAHIEIAQHGFQHQRILGLPEWVSGDRQTFASQLDQGLKIIKSAFGKAPLFFVPPYDSVSKAALQEIQKRFRGICLSPYSHHIVPIQLWPSFLYCKHRKRFLMRWGDFSILRHPGLDFTFLEEATLDAEIVKRIASVSDILVITLHSWRFFRSDGALNRPMFERWEDFLRRLIQTEGVRFLNFSDINR